MENKIVYYFENGIDTEFSTGVYKKGASRSINLHGNFEMLIVERGEMLCSIDGTDYRVKEGEAAFICPLQIHSFKVQNDSTVRRVTFCENIVLTLSNAIKQKRAENPVFKPKKEDLDYFLAELSSLFGNDEFATKRITPSASRIKVKGLLYIIESSFLSQAKLIPYLNSKNAVIDVVHFISQNYLSDISLQDAAEKIGYNHQYLSRELNKNLGVSFTTILNQYRMNHAYAMLQDTSLSVNQIALESGFRSIRNFNQVCLNMFGKSPKEVRKDTDIT